MTQSKKQSKVPSNKDIVGMIKALKDFRQQVTSNFNVDNPDDINLISGGQILYESPKGSVIAITKEADMKLFGKFMGAYEQHYIKDAFRDGDREEYNPLLICLPFIKGEASYASRLCLSTDAGASLKDHVRDTGNMTQKEKIKFLGAMEDLILEITRKNVDTAIELLSNGLLYYDVPDAAWDNPDFLKAAWKKDMYFTAMSIDEQHWTEDLCKTFLCEGEVGELFDNGRSCSLIDFIEKNPDIEKKIIYGEWGARARDSYNGWHDDKEAEARAEAQYKKAIGLNYAY